MEVDKIFSKYKTENGDLIEHIQHTIDEKQNTGDWDIGIDNQSDSLLSMLMYEYASSIEKLTDGKLTAKQVIDKLSNQMGKFRVGDFKTGKDDSITYDGNAVTSELYKKQCRVDSKFGANAIEYKDDEGKSKTAVVLFDDKQVATINGEQHTLSGIDLQDLSDIRQTVFHEWTHIMERCMVKASKLSREDIIFKDGNSTFINAMLSSDLSMEEYKAYISNIDELLESDAEVPFGGISTIEVNNKKCPNRRIMHNQISEGATEFIARKVMETIGEDVKHPDRYAEQVRIIGDIFNVNGLPEMITQYFTEPHKVIRGLEDKSVKGKDMLHYISDYINSSHLSKVFNRINIDETGNVRTGIISKLIDRFKRSFSKKDTVLLTDGSSNPIGDTREKYKNEFLESQRVPPEELANNAERQQTEKCANRTR